LSDSFERAARLKKARIDRGFQTAKIAAEYISVPYGTYSGHENGSRGIKEAELLHYAKIFRVSPSWLAFGDEHVTNTVKLTGEITGQDSLDVGASKKLQIKKISSPIPVPAGVTALLVSTNDFSPNLVKDDVVLIGVKSAPDNLINKRVALSNRNTIIIGTLLTAAKTNHFHIQLFNGKMILNINPQWLAPIVGIIYKNFEYNHK
jgi:hypothetical protein